MRLRGSIGSRTALPSHSPTAISLDIISAPATPKPTHRRAVNFCIATWTTLVSYAYSPFRDTLLKSYTSNGSSATTCICQKALPMNSLLLIILRPSNDIRSKDEHQAHFQTFCHLTSNKEYDSNWYVSLTMYTIQFIFHAFVSYFVWQFISSSGFT